MIRNGLTHIITYYDTKRRISGIVTVGPRMCRWEKRQRNERPHPPPIARRQSFPSILVWSGPTRNAQLLPRMGNWGATEEVRTDVRRRKYEKSNAEQAAIQIQYCYYGK